jgi:hypothetical protein
MKNIPTRVKIKIPTKSIHQLSAKEKKTKAFKYEM